MKKTTATIAHRAKRRNLLGEGILNVRLSSGSYCEPQNAGRYALKMKPRMLYEVVGSVFRSVSIGWVMDRTGRDVLKLCI